MQHLKEKWLKLFNAFYAIGSLAMLIAYGIFALQQQTLLPANTSQYGINLFTAIIASICLIHATIALKLIKRFNVWLAYSIPYVLYGVMLSASIELSINFKYSLIYIVILTITSFMSIAYGNVVSFATIAVILILFGMELAGNSRPTILGVTGDSFIVAIRVLGASLLLFLVRNKYIIEGQDNTKTYVERYFVDNEVVKLLTDSISDGVMITDKNGIIRSINQAASKLLKQEIKDLIDLDYRSILRFKSNQHTDITEDENPISLALSNRQAKNTVYILELNDKQEIFTDIVASAIKNSETTEVYGCVIIMRDVSQTKKEEEARSEFISTASHEMRTPVAAIEGYLALALNENVAQIDEKARAFLQKAHQSTEHLGRLFQDLLVSAKAEDGRLVSHPAVMEMGDFLEQLTDDLKLITSKRGLGLEYVTGTGENITSTDKSHAVRPLYYVYADPDRLREIITNLFDNAVKYTSNGKITIGLTGNKDVVQFFVRDTGSGIPAEDIPHLFQKFYRVDNRTTRTTGGTGLGLFISRKILELYNGRIWVESEINKGSTFYVNLPRIDSTKANQLTNQPTPTASISIKPTSNN
jgi:signal transduction histidine kinase